MNAPTICRLSIERFRCIKTFTWHPTKDINVILGGGDVGKTTILDAIALLLSPTNPVTLSDIDYHAREIAAGFVIEAIVSADTERYQSSDQTVLASADLFFSSCSKKHRCDTTDEQ